MKTVPHFYNNSKPVAQMDIVQNKDKENISFESFNGKLAFNDIFRQDSSARFMKVDTDLMEEVGIFKNDILVIDPQLQCVNGKVIVVKVGETLMVRRYEKIKSGVILYGDSKKISPLKIEEGYDQFKILGVVVYIIKSL